MKGTVGSSSRRWGTYLDMEPAGQLASGCLLDKVRWFSAVLDGPSICRRVKAQISSPARHQLMASAGVTACRTRAAPANLTSHDGADVLQAGEQPLQQALPPAHKRLQQAGTAQHVVRSRQAQQSRL